MNRKSGFVAAVALAAITGCATRAVHHKWQALDAVERVSFSLSSPRDDRAVLRWKVESAGLADRRGSREIEIPPEPCESLELAVQGQVVQTGERPRWVTLTARSQALLVATEISSSSPTCRVYVSARSWTRNSDPRFLVQARDREERTIRVRPARRSAWLLVYPFSVVADTAVIVPTAGILLVGAITSGFDFTQLDDFSWIPGEEPDFHRTKSDRKREGAETE